MSTGEKIIGRFQALLCFAKMTEIDNGECVIKQVERKIHPKHVNYASVLKDVYLGT
jgi:hypothetical protein